MKAFFKKIFQFATDDIVQRKVISSNALQRDVVVDILLPTGYRKSKRYPLIIFNDGQDFPALNIEKTVNDLYKTKLIGKTIIVGVHCNDNRINEYGVAGIPDYANRGNKASEYNQFIINELLAFLRKNYAVSNDKKDLAMAGFSLGALSAFDIVWNNSEVFSKVGVFSGALWWRSEPCREEDPDANRILHDMVLRGKKQEGLRFWFQTGTRDEDSDRNHNGVIDAIDDTLDLINCLRQKGYTDADLAYVEIEDGEHNPQTWSRAMLAFLLYVCKV
jgi:enterochelin esterase-like enzyme